MDRIIIFIQKEKITQLVSEHLGPDVTILPYETCASFVSKLPEVLQGESHGNTKVLVDVNQCNLAIYESLSMDNIIELPSPISLEKSLKNEEEQEGLRHAHIVDGVALVSFLSWLERALAAGPQGNGLGMGWPLTEASISDKLEEFRSQQEGYVSLSFATIAGYGPNGAIIHYKPEYSTAAEVHTNNTLLLDSGGQYVDGTTDVTRTVHYGIPTDYQKKANTLVLKGHIGLAIAKFPEGTLGSRLDATARLPLWSHGMEYRHGTGHGVGAFLNVHEGPQGIGFRKRANEQGFLPGMTTSNEPGYYETGSFGIRIESVCICKEAKLGKTFDNIKFCEFETITMAPIQTKLIDKDYLNLEEIQWVNTYNAKVREKLEPLIKDKDVLDYLYRETEKF